MAARLLESPLTDRVDLFEPRPDLAAGIAYGTEHPGHLLNVPARGMSAFPDRPDHFVRWLQGQQKWVPEGGWTPQSFAPRRLYRDYLLSLIKPYTGENPGRLRVHRTQVVDLRETASGVDLTAADGGRYTADAAILATGNESPGGKPAPWRRDYWSSPSGFDIAPDAPVVVIGTGLSMIDSVISLLDAGHTAPISAISRRGLVPRPHDLCPPLQTDRSEIPLGASVAALCQWLRRRVRNGAADCAGNWRAIVDGLRPYTQEIWRDLPLAEQQRFLRHARPWWDVHRHRMAPQIHERIAAAEASGQLLILAGRLASIDGDDAGVTVRFTRRGEKEAQTLRARYLVDCRGHSADAASTGNPLLATLFARGVLRPDPLRIALDVTADCAVRDAGGAPSRRVFAIGPATVGAFWEIVAMPDIRTQVQRLAGRLRA